MSSRDDPVGLNKQRTHSIDQDYADDHFEEIDRVSADSFMCSCKHCPDEPLVNNEASKCCHSEPKNAQLCRQEGVQCVKERESIYSRIRDKVGTLFKHV